MDRYSTPILKKSHIHDKNHMKVSFIIEKNKIQMITYKKNQCKQKDNTKLIKMIWIPTYKDIKTNLKSRPHDILVL